MIINSFSISKTSTKLVPILILIMSLSFLGLGTAQTQTEECEQCGMTVDAIGQQRLVIVDQDGNNHIACCPICALKLLKTYPSLTITAFCDYRGPDYPIIITATNSGKDVTVNPESALIIAAGSCTKNRIVYDPQAADALLSEPNNGTSTWLSPMTNAPVAKNATRLSINQASIKYSGLTLDPTECEACSMTVTSDSQWRYSVTDGEGNKHNVECYMCALKLINQYETLTIETTCDWYGPGYPIIVESKGYGNTVTVTPSTAIFLRGGSCVTARAAYNQTAADNLLTNGFSKYTSTEQQYTLPSTTEVKTVNNAIQTWYSQADTAQGPASITLIFALIIGLIIIGGSVIAYKKMKH